MQASRGFSLIEVLVTLLLTTIGILGMVAMQGRAIQYTQDSVQRTHAAMLAGDLFERIKANAGNADAYEFDSLPEAASEPSECLELSNTQIDEQLACWSIEARSLLPGAADLADEFHVCLSRTPGECDGGSAVEIQVAWRAQGEGCLDPEAEEDEKTICRYRIRSEP